MGMNTTTTNKRTKVTTLLKDNTIVDLSSLKLKEKVLLDKKNIEPQLQRSSPFKPGGELGSYMFSESNFNKCCETHTDFG